MKLADFRMLLLKFQNNKLKSIDFEEMINDDILHIVFSHFSIKEIQTFMEVPMNDGEMFVSSI